MKRDIKTDVADKIEYVIVCISEFAKRYSLSLRQSYNYLDLHKGIEFLDKTYNAEHQFSIDDAIDDVTAYCQRHGGALA